MATGVKTATIVDPRILPEAEPVYAVSVSPTESQYYSLPASAISDSYVAFNNFTTLGADRAYLNSMEIEWTITLECTVEKPADSSTYTGLEPEDFTFKSFPMNRMCDNITVNVNGGTFFGNPLYYLNAKERYWDTAKIQESYSGVCPSEKAWIRNEMGLNAVHDLRTISDIGTARDRSRSRLSRWRGSYQTFESGATGTWNSSIVPMYPPFLVTSSTADPTQRITLTWREPIFCSPFASKLDADYGQPLYNITSLDIAMNLKDLRNMILINSQHVTDFNIHIQTAVLKYQVMSVPKNISPDISMIPYRRFVPYITNVVNLPGQSAVTALQPNQFGAPHTVSATSGVYSLNEIPTAIWVFLAPDLSSYQTFDPTPDFYDSAHGYTGTNYSPSEHIDNQLFGYLKHISISCGNTTQILNTAAPSDLFRIAKANGCKDSGADWITTYPTYPYERISVSQTAIDAGWGPAYSGGAGSVLRLIPGTDIILPDQKLIPGSRADNLVFQVSGTWEYPNSTNKPVTLALWILFEYVGVATITPGQCVIDMCPVKSESQIASGPVIIPEEMTPTIPTTEGSGWKDTLLSILKGANQIAKKTGIVSKLAGYIPKVGPAIASAAAALGYGEKGMKRLRGGAVMGMGDFI